MRQAIKVVRGLMVILVIAAHWAPFFIDHAGPYQRVLTMITNPVFRLGTPGFALIFGLRIGFNLVPREREMAGTIHSQLTRSRKLLFLGISVLALINAIVLELTHQVNGSFVGALFYSVLLYYFLATFFVEPTCAHFMKSRAPVREALIISVVSVAISTFLRQTWLRPETGVMFLVQEAIIAKYGIFEMSFYVFLGLSLGMYLEKACGKLGVEETVLGAAVCLFVFGVTLSFSTGLENHWFTNSAYDPEHPMLISYLGVFIALIVGARRLVGRLGADSTGATVYRTLAVFGTMSLGAYVGHELVIPIARVLTISGLKDSWARFLCAMCFVIYFYHKTSRRYSEIYRGG